MTHDTTQYDETLETPPGIAPPLCLVHYFAERAAYPPERNPHPPGGKSLGRVVARDGNLIILEFAAPPEPPRKRWAGGCSGKSLMAQACDILLLLLLLACFAGCIAAFRF